MKLDFMGAGQNVCYVEKNMVNKRTFTKMYGIEFLAAEKEKNVLTKKLPHLSWFSEEKQKKIIERYHYLVKILSK